MGLSALLRMTFLSSTPSLISKCPCTAAGQESGWWGSAPELTQVELLWMMPYISWWVPAPVTFLQLLEVELSFASLMAVWERTNTRGVSSPATLLFPSPLPGECAARAGAEPDAAVSSRSKPRGCFVQGKGTCPGSPCPSSSW